MDAVPVSARRTRSCCMSSNSRSSGIRAGGHSPTRNRGQPLCTPRRAPAVVVRSFHGGRMQLDAFKQPTLGSVLPSSAARAIASLPTRPPGLSHIAHTQWPCGPAVCAYLRSLPPHHTSTSTCASTIATTSRSAARNVTNAIPGGGHAPCGRQPARTVLLIHAAAHPGIQAPTSSYSDPDQDPGSTSSQYGTAQHLEVLRRAAKADRLEVGNGPLGRGLFATAAVRAGQPLLSLPDVCVLVVRDPEQPPYQIDPGGPQQGDGAANGGVDGDTRNAAGLDGPIGTAAFATGGTAPSSNGVGVNPGAATAGAGSDWQLNHNMNYASREHEDYLRRWQAHHALRLPPGLLELLADSDGLPATARLALWLMWIRRQCAGAAPAAGNTADPAVAGATSASQAAAPVVGPSVSASTASAGSPGSTYREDARGLAFWRSYLRSLPDPGDVTSLSVFSEDEAALLQVPGYVAQWHRARDSLSWLLEVANEAAAHDRERGSPHFTGASSVRDSSSSNGSSESSSRGGASVDGSDRYNMGELSYCYAMATSRGFHLPGRLLFVPFADLGNHQPLWQAGAFPFWQPNDLYGSDDAEGDRNGRDNGSDNQYGRSREGGGYGQRESNGAARGDAAAAAAGCEEFAGVSGWFQFRAVRDLDPGTEVCICYSEGGNAEQLSTYGFVRQANPYDRLDLNPHQTLPAPGQDAGAAARNASLPEGMRLCWPAVVAAAGFWAPQPSPSHSSVSAMSSDQQPQGQLNAKSVSAPDGESDSEGETLSLAERDALEQSLLRPRGSVAPLGRLALDLDPAARMRLQRRRAALLSLPHTAEDAEALSRWGLGWAASPKAELQNWARRQAAAAGRGAAGERAVLVSELEAVDALLEAATGMQRAMPTGLEYDEALWREMTEGRRGGRDDDGGGADGSGSDGGGWARKLGRAVNRWLGGRWGAEGGRAAAAEKAEAGVYDSPRGRTALLARLEHKRVLAQAVDILASYRRQVDAALSGFPR